MSSPISMLEIGLARELHVRHEQLSDHTDACRVVYVSDLHLRPRRSEVLCRQTLEAVARCRPDVVLLGGDLVDRASELPALRDLTRRLARLAPVMAVGGNHDARVGMTRVRDAVVLGGGQWIHDGTTRITHGTRVVTFAGPGSAPPTDGHVRVLCAHNPRIWKTAQHAGYHLVLAGHLHGFQLVACQYRNRLFPGALFYPYCFFSHQRGMTRLVVSRGVSDLLPIRWMCPREVVLCVV
ncbi:MAG: metallophosphoesterase family protein [Acidobacteria bacterium]|nr:metallophosphoesterase family protein [Acidobacteriota bacterium]